MGGMRNQIRTVNIRRGGTGPQSARQARRMGWLTQDSRALSHSTC